VDIQTSLERWPFKEPFSITGHTFSASDVLVVRVCQDGLTGWGETSGAYYKNETPAQMAAQISRATAGCRALDRRDLPFLLRERGARNALDCALWDLEAKRAGRPAWSLAGLDPPRPLPTTYTLGANSPARMAVAALGFADATHVKLKLTGDGSDAERVRAVRKARPDVWLMVDANQGFTRDGFRALLPTLVEERVSLIEQPFRIGREVDLDGLRSPIPIAADESVQGVDDIASLAGYFDVINIKLDKCGGLTEALLMVEECRRLGLEVMVGNMMGTSLSLAPAYLVGQLCDFVDLDGALFLAADRTPCMSYSAGVVTCPTGLWGYPKATKNEE
jgi:L-Ala-D/L-Glu epimerase